LNLVELSLFFLIPLALLLGSWLIQRQWRMRLNAAVDMFIFLMSLDVTLLVWYDTGILRVNPIFVSVYRPLFGVLLAFSFVLLGLSNRVQWRIYQATVSGEGHYPLWGVMICWLLAMASISFHLYAVLGGASWAKR
jgi:hypothetical protein